MGPEWAGVVGGVVGGTIGAGAGAWVRFIQNKGELAARKLEFRREYHVDLLKELRVNLREFQDAVERARMAAADLGISTEIDRADFGGFAAVIRDGLFPRNEWLRKKSVAELMGSIPTIAARIRDDEIDRLLPMIANTFTALAEPKKDSEMDVLLANTTELFTRMNQRVRVLLNQAESELSNLLT